MTDIAGDRISYKIDIDGLTKLSGMQRTIQQIEKLIPKMDGAVKSAKDSMEKFDHAIKSVDDAKFEKMARDADKLHGGIDGVTRSVKQTDTALGHARSRTEEFGSAMQRANGKVHFAQQSRDLSALSGKMMDFGMNATMGLAAITAGTGVAIKAAKDLQNEFKVINNLAVTGGESPSEAKKNVAQMSKDSRRYSDEYGVKQTKIAKGYETLNRRGYTTAQALGSQNSYLQGALASGDSYDDVVDNGASAIEQFGMKSNSVKGMKRASKTAINQMAYSADLTATGFGGLGEALKYAGPDAHAAHQSLHTTASAIGELSNFGIDGSQAGTSMRQIYQRLINPPSKGKAPNAMDKLRLKYSDFRDAHNELLPIQDIFAKLDSKMKGMSKTDKGAIYAALFGVNASSAAQALGASYKQVDALDKKVSKAQDMNGGKGYVAKLSEKNLDTFQNQWNRVKQGLLNSGVDIANAWMPTLTKLAKSVADILEKFQGLPEPVKKFTGAALAITAVVGPLALVAGSLMKMHSALGAISKLGGGKGKTGILGSIADLVGFGGKSEKSSGRTTKFSSKARIPGSWLLNESGRGKNVSVKAPGPIKTWLGNTRVGKRASAIKQGAKSLLPTLWGDTKTIAKGGVSKATSLVGKIPGISRMGSIAKGGLSIAGKVASRIPILDVAMAGTNLIGMNQKNAGKKVGSATGMLAGGAIGSLFGPIGGMAGAAIGQTLGAKFGATIQKALPKKVQKSIGSAVKSVQKTFSKLLKPFQSVTRSISKVWSSATKGVSKSWEKYVVKPLSGKGGGDAIKGAMKVFKSVLVPTMKVAGVAFKVFGAVAKTAIKAVGHILSGLIKTVSGTFALVSDLIHGRWKNAWKDAVQIFSGIFGTIKNVLSDILGSVWDGITDLAKNLGDLVLHPIKTIKRWLSGGTGSSGGDGITKNVKTAQSIGSGKGAPKQSKPKINVQTGIGKATGGPISKTQLAMVNEAGTELAYNPLTGKFRTLGNGPTVTRLFAGEHVLNAKDTRQLYNGGLGKGKTLPGFAKGTSKLTTAIGSTSVSLKGANLSKTSESTKKSMKSISKSIQNGYTKSNKVSTKQMTQLQKKSTSTFKDLTSDTKKQTQKLQKNTVGDFDDTQKNSMTQMKQMYKGVQTYVKAIYTNFKDGINNLPVYAQSAMSKTISALNRGFKSINSVLSQFGGNKATLNLAHYATGSKGPISHDQLAVVNDASVGPHQEAIVRSGNVMFPKGRNVVTKLQKGDEVLNGSETRQMFGALPHYAKGTGGAKRLIKKNNKAPKAAFKSDFDNKLSLAVNPALTGGVGKTGKGASDSLGNPWYASVWRVLNNAMSGSGAGGPVTHAPGSGWSVSSGFGYRGSTGGGYSNHDGVDFDGAKTVHSMNTGTVQRVGGPPSNWGGDRGIGQSVVIGGGGLNYIYQELNGKYGSGAKILVSKGDSVKAGQAIAVLGPSGSHVHVGATKHPMFSIPGSSTAGWLNPLHVKSSEVKVKQSDTKSSALDKFVKKQLASQVKWVGKNLSEDDIGSIGSLGVSGSLKSRATTLAAALKKLYPSATMAGISAILGNWNFESGGLNPSIQNSIGASGLGQWLNGRFTNLKNFAAKKGKSWKDAGVQLEFALKGEGSDSALFRSVLSGHGSVSSLAARFSTGWERGGHTAEHVNGARQVAAALHANGGWAETGKLNIFGEVPGESEVAINTHRPSADPLIVEAMSDRASKSPNGIFAQFKSFLKMQKELAKMKASQTKFSATSKASLKPKSGNVTIRPQFTYSPKIAINGSGDANETGKIVSKQLTNDRRQFVTMINDFCDMILASL